MKLPYRAEMERSIFGKLRTHLWVLVLVSFLLWFLLLLYFFYSTLLFAMFSNLPLSLFSHTFSNISNVEDNGFRNDDQNTLSDHITKDLSNNFSNSLGESTKNEYWFREDQNISVLLDNVEKQFQLDNILADLIENEDQSVDENHHVVEKSARKIIKQPKFDVDSHHDRHNLHDHVASCKVRYIYVHDLPKKFNQDLITNCKSLSNWTDMCMFTENLGFGPYIKNFGRVYSNNGWFATNQFLLEVIFHNRMKHYDCLTKNSSIASAIFVPYYAGLDVSRYLWGYNTTLRDSSAIELVQWLKKQPEWKRMGGRDHFLVAGRITWDFRRTTDEESNWGNKLLYLPESKNMTILVIESSPWSNNDFAIPYPTYFHPSSDNELFRWQSRMRKQKRRTLFSFAGGPRPNLRNSIRNEIFNQCRRARTCTLLECRAAKASRCYKPVYVMKMFQSSVFRLQPPGDSFTRRSTFDSILAGCIPVFFHPGSAYVQYLWHLPKDYTKYSVFIPENEIKDGKTRIEKILSKIPDKKVKDMREEVIRLIPKIIYSNPPFRLKNHGDAFDLSVKGVLERVSKIRKEIEEGKNTSFDFPEEFSWKCNLFGTVEKHEWDAFFAKYRM